MAKNINGWHITSIHIVFKTSFSKSLLVGIGFSVMLRSHQVWIDDEDQERWNRQKDVKSMFLNAYVGYDELSLFYRQKVESNANFE